MLIIQRPLLKQAKIYEQGLNANGFNNLKI